MNLLLRRSPSLSLVTLLALGCGNEANIIEQLPPVETNLAPPVRPERWTDRFPLWEPPVRKVDVLWVVDGSCSMTNDRALLEEHLPVFMAHFYNTGIDYHIGVVDAGGQPNSGQLLQANGNRWIDPSTENPTAAFTAMVGQVVGQSRGTQAVYDALETLTDGYNRGFRRDDASVHSIIISDERDGPPPFGFFDWYLSLKADPQDRTFSSIVDPADNSFYERATEEIGGVYHDINTGGWEAVLDQLSFIAATPSDTEVLLSHPPFADSIVVELREGTKGDEVVVERLVEAEYDEEGIPLSGHWTYDKYRNSVRFVADLPKVGQETLVVHYLRRNDGFAEAP